MNQVTTTGRVKKAPRGPRFIPRDDGNSSPPPFASGVDDTERVSEIDAQEADRLVASGEQLAPHTSADSDPGRAALPTLVDDKTPEARGSEPSPEGDEKRRTSGARRRTRVTLTADAVRDALEARYRNEGHWEALVDHYLTRIEGTRDAKEKSALWKQVGQVFAHQMGEPAQALDAFLVALGIDPRDESTVVALEEIGRREGWFPRIVKSVAALLPPAKSGDAEERGGRLTLDDEVELGLSELLARWCKNQLKDPKAAEPFLHRVRRIDPANPLVQRRLASVYRKQGALSAQEAALSRALLGAKRKEDKAGAHLALGELCEHRLHDAARAEEHYEAALAIDPGCMEALRGLERMCRVHEKLARLAEVLERQASAAPKDEERIAVLLRLADLHERQFLRPKQAAEKLERVLALDETNLAALAALERCYRAMRAWRALVSTFERKAELSENPLEKCDLFMRAAEVLETQEKDTEAALAMYRRVYELDSGHRQALLELARLSEKQKDHTGAAAYRSRVCDLTDNPRAKAQLHAQIGDMMRTEDRDLQSAQLHFEKAVEIDPANVVAWEALQRLALRRGDEMHAVFCLEKRANNTDSPRMKAQLLVELGRLRESLGDVRGAFATFEFASRTDPTNEAAAREVFDAYVAEERFSEASPMCDLLINAATRDGDKDRVFDLLQAAARIASALGDEERALTAAMAALTERPADLVATHDLLATVHRCRQSEALLARAKPAILRIVARTNELSPDALVLLAEIGVAAREWAMAEVALRRALAIDEAHHAALKNLTQLFLDRGDVSRACNCKQRLALVTRDKELRHALILEAAELWETRGKNLPKAALLLEDALAEQPKDSVVLHRLVGLYTSLELWDKLVGALGTIAEIETDRVRKGKTLYALAGVLHKNLGDPRAAAKTYQRVVDVDPSRGDAFDKIVAILSELRAYADLRDAYLHMLERTSDTSLRHALYRALGLLYRDKLGDVARALDALRAASNLRPGDDEDRRAAVELLVVMEQLDVAISTVRTAIARAPLSPGRYRDLYALFLRDNAIDKAYAAIDALAHLGDLRADEASFLEQNRPPDVTAFPGTLAPTAWVSHLLHPGLDGRLSAVLRALTPAILRMRFGAASERQRRACLGQRLRGDESGAAARLVQIVSATSEILGVPLPELFDRPSSPVPLAVAPTPTPALFVSLGGVESLPDNLLPYLVARRMGELRPELAAHALFPTVSELRSLIKAATRVATLAGSKSAASLMKSDEQKLALSMSPRELDALREAVSLIVGGAPRVEVKRWLELCDASLSRAALLVSPSFDAAFRAMQRDSRAPCDLSAGDWRKEMLAFSVSDAHAELRAAVGVSLEG